jgi:hypothetical protein
MQDLKRHEWPSSDGQTNFVADVRGVWLEGPSRARLSLGPPIEVAAEILRLAGREKALVEAAGALILAIDHNATDYAVTLGRVRSLLKE